MENLSPIDIKILNSLLFRSNLTLKSAHTSDLLSYRQFLRHVETLVSKNVINGWIPIVNPKIMGKKLAWFFLRTNPRDPQDLSYLKSLSGKLISLDGVAGPFSLISLLQFNSNDDFLHTLELLDKRFNVPDPFLYPLRYQWREITDFYKYNGILVPHESIGDNLIKELKPFLDILIEYGKHSKKPPSIEILSKKINKSSSTVNKYLKKLFEEKLILAHSIKINTKFIPQLKCYIQFFISSNLIETIQILSEIPSIHTLCKIQSDSFSLLAIAYTNTINEFNDLLREIYEKAPIQDTLTTIVLNDEFKNTIVASKFPIF